MASRSKHQNAFIGLAYEAGLRSGEVQNLMWDDFDMTPGQACVVVRRKEGDPKKGILPFEPKDHECRTVPIGDHLLALLQQLKREQGGRQSPYVFLNGERRDKLVSRWQAGTWQSGDQLLNNVIRGLRVLCQRAELGEQAVKLTFHDLRRACLTNLAESGMAIHELKAMAGHASVTTTEKYYLHVRRETGSCARVGKQDGAGWAG